MLDQAGSPPEATAMRSWVTKALMEAHGLERPLSLKDRSSSNKPAFIAR